ncbi:CinA family protein [Salinisphaera sp. USBA-960]|uniref:CinA family protein n=1 Tax=Salinisphaera orenii TaxID=856731 RepID=UPI000DBE67FA|nr:CinA family protein [Salifodinibacter halophilus]NNC25708.1 CinA family protein [Salifodinibacter halophilus]
MSSDNDDAIAGLVARVAGSLEARGESLVAAESCTGGLIAAACTDRAGSSVWFDRGFVTYADDAKMDCLSVAKDTIVTHGAVSETVVRAMCTGALAASTADWSVAVSGIAGPGGGSNDKPVGTVVIGWQRRGEAPEALVYHFDGDRGAVRSASVCKALAGLERRLAVAE